MLAVAGRADLLGKFDDLLIRGEAGNGEQVGRGVNVSRGCGVPDCDVESMAVGWQSIAELEETVCTDVVGGSGERERLSLEGDAQGGGNHTNMVSNGVVPFDGQAAGLQSICGSGCEVGGPLCSR